ncbi:tetratricopeptide repeat-containing S1 family peptidase [Planktothrix agardhii]|uniref:tetratricopeptide repeat-containing S1 family peptidase n=1 Tax=Planktothrix agardhii TaxID=1160 RepID=UPI001D0B4EA9|nr:tetratricopeptide repeat-containing serine protease family protein [Planktothrix agardhii]MCB8749998.1 tetratricopeptide repeat-containing serine protease family protein [Planktothrix agardhii 1810]
MGLGLFSSDSLLYLLTGTATVVTLVVSQSATVLAKTAQQVAEIAEPITVQINSPLGDGSGVIIAKNGKVYTVLTVNHVVEDPNVKYTVRTSDGNSHPQTKIVRLQNDDKEPDLAIIQFESSQNYPIATLGNSEQAVIGAQIYVYGYPATGGLTGVEREPELSPGLVTSRPKSRPEGYNLRYQAVTWSGMSGGPVFDSEGRVVGLHGQGEFGFAQTSSGDVAPIKTGFNAAIPINLFITKLLETGLKSSDLVIDEKLPEANPVSLDFPRTYQAFYFQGLTLLDQGETWDAIDAFNHAIELDPNTPEAYFNRGIARTLLATNIGEPTRAPNPIEDYTEAIRLNPGFADAYYNRALAYLELKNKINARSDFQKAAELYDKLGRKAAYQEVLNRLKELE